MEKRKFVQIINYNLQFGVYVCVLCVFLFCYGRVSGCVCMYSICLWWSWSSRPIVLRGRHIATMVDDIKHTEYLWPSIIFLSVLQTAHIAHFHFSFSFFYFVRFVWFDSDNGPVWLGFLFCRVRLCALVFLVPIGCMFVLEMPHRTSSNIQPGIQCIGGCSTLIAQYVCAVRM